MPAPPPPDGTGPPGALADRAARSSLWSVLAQMAQLIVGVLAFLLFAPLLSPAEYGMVGLAATITGFLGVVGDGGIIAALLRQGEIDSRTRSTAFCVSLVGGLALTALAALCAPLLGWFYGDTKVTWMALALS